MDKNKSELEEFMGDLASKSNAYPLENKSEDPFNHLEKKEEVAEEVKESKEEKPLPFNKDPKIQKFIEKEISKRLENFKPESTRETPQVDTEKNEMLAQMIGNDTPEKVAMIKRFGNYLDTLKGSAKAEALEEFQSLKNRELEADREAEQELETAFENIEENYDFDFSTTLGKKTRQEFASFVEKIAPKDQYGDIVDYPDMNSAWETFSELKKSTGVSNRAKELASRSMQRSAETSSEPILKRGRTPFSNSDDFIESLSK
jgi:hypothetical protein